MTGSYKLILYFRGVPSDTMLEQARELSREACREVLVELRQRGWNIITAESVTAGLISARLVDIPMFGGCVYGGFVVYDTEAKRRMLGVEQADVYTEAAAGEMAVGALRNSGAKVAVSATGNAGPVDDVERLGVVDIGCAIRASNSPFVRTARYKLIDPDSSSSTNVRELIRELTVSAAADHVLTTIREFSLDV